MSTGCVLLFCSPKGKKTGNNVVPSFEQFKEISLICILNPDTVDYNSILMEFDWIEFTGQSGA